MTFDGARCTRWFTLWRLSCPYAHPKTSCVNSPPVWR